MVKEFLKLENRLILKLEIIPLSPLLIKLGDGKEEKAKDGNTVVFITSDSTQIPEEISDIKKFVEYNKEENIIIKDDRKGEPFIPGSTLKGLFRERFNQIYGIEGKEENEEIKTLFGFVPDKKEKNQKEKKGRIFLEDAYLSNEEYRKIFHEESYDKILNLKKKIIKTRDITPIDAFTGKATVPLKFEYIDEKFITILTVNNITQEELKNLYFIIRDSILGEIRIGNSKTRGFGQVKFEIEDFIFENYCTNNKDEKYRYIEDLKEFFTLEKKESLKIGERYLRENLKLKDKEVDIENPSKFIRNLFGEGDE